MGATGWGGPRRYRSDDRDMGEDHDLDLMILPPDGNGDWYVSVLPHGDRFGRAVRITTSGTPHGQHGVCVAVADLYRAMGGEDEARPKEPRRDPADRLTAFERLEAAIGCLRGWPDDDIRDAVEAFDAWKVAREADPAASADLAPALDREALGRIVREEWIAWAREQPNPKPSWLVPWEGLSEPDREVDRRIGERLAREGARVAPSEDEQTQAERWAGLHYNAFHFRFVHVTKPWADLPSEAKEPEIAAMLPLVREARGHALAVERLTQQVEILAGRSAAAEARFLTVPATPAPLTEEEARALHDHAIDAWVADESDARPQREVIAAAFVDLSRGDIPAEVRPDPADPRAEAHARIAAMPEEKRHAAMRRASRSWSAPGTCLRFDGCKLHAGPRPEIEWPDGERWPTDPEGRIDIADVAPWRPIVGATVIATRSS